MERWTETLNKMKQYYLKTREIFLKKQSLLKLIAAGFLAVVLVGSVLSHMEFYYIEKFFRRSLFGKHMFLAIVTPIILLIPVWRGKAARIFQAAGFIIVPYLAVKLVQDLADISLSSLTCVPSGFHVDSYL